MTDLVHVACPRCEALNRLPRSRLSDRPRCGKCQQLLFGAHPVAVTGPGLEKHLRGDLSVLVEFWAPWCGYCQKMAPAFVRAAAALEPQMRLATVNTDEEKGVGARYGIQGLPTIVLFRQGREIARQSGAMTTAAIVEWARSHG